MRIRASPQVQPKMDDHGIDRLLNSVFKHARFKSKLQESAVKAALESRLKTARSKRSTHPNVRRNERRLRIDADRSGKVALLPTTRRIPRRRLVRRVTAPRTNRRSSAQTQRARNRNGNAQLAPDRQRSSPNRKGPRISRT